MTRSNIVFRNSLTERNKVSEVHHTRRDIKTKDVGSEKLIEPASDLAGGEVVVLITKTANVTKIKRKTDKRGNNKF